MARHVSSNGKRQSGGGGSRSTAIALAAGALVASAILWLWWQSATVAGTPTSSASATTTTTTAPETPAEATTNEAPAATVDSTQAELAEPRSTWFEVPAGGQSIKVHALEVGPRSIQSTGDPLFVLVHGGSPKQDAEHWRALLAGFAPLGRTIAVDMPGHGKSPAARAQPMAILQHVIDAECSAQSPAERNVILVGRSWGGGVVLQSLTLQLRASVRRLVLIGASACATVVLATLLWSLTRHLPVATAPAGAVPNTIPQDFLQQTPVLLVWYVSSVVLLCAPLSHSQLTAASCVAWQLHQGEG